MLKSLRYRNFIRSAIFKHVRAHRVPQIKPNVVTSLKGGSAWGCWILSYQLKFRPFLSYQLKFESFLSYQLVLTDLS